MLLLRRQLANVLPHNVENGRADETVLDGAGEQKGTCVLHKGTHDVRTSALEHVMRPLETSGYPDVVVVMFTAMARSAQTVMKTTFGA